MPLEMKHEAKIKLKVCPIHIQDRFSLCSHTYRNVTVVMQEELWGHVKTGEVLTIS